jgi:hypothetical protein
VILIILFFATFISIPFHMWHHKFSNTVYVLFSGRNWSEQMVLLFAVFLPWLYILDMEHVYNKESGINLNFWKMFVFQGTNTWHSTLIVILIYYFNLWEPNRARIAWSVSWLIYGLDGPGFESRPALWPNQPPIHWVPGFFLGGKVAEAWCLPLTSI